MKTARDILKKIRSLLEGYSIFGLLNKLSFLAPHGIIQLKKYLDAQSLIYPSNNTTLSESSLGQLLLILAEQDSKWQGQYLFNSLEHYLEIKPSYKWAVQFLIELKICNKENLAFLYLHPEEFRIVYTSIYLLEKSKQESILKALFSANDSKSYLHNLLIIIKFDRKTQDRLTLVDKLGVAFSNPVHAQGNLLCPSMLLPRLEKEVASLAQCIEAVGVSKRTKTSIKQQAVSLRKLLIFAAEWHENVISFAYQYLNLFFELNQSNVQLRSMDFYLSRLLFKLEDKTTQDDWALFAINLTHMVNALANWPVRSPDETQHYLQEKEAFITHFSKGNPIEWKFDNESSTTILVDQSIIATMYKKNVSRLVTQYPAVPFDQLEKILPPAVLKNFTDVQAECVTLTDTYKSRAVKLLEDASVFNLDTYDWVCHYNSQFSNGVFLATGFWIANEIKMLFVSNQNHRISEALNVIFTKLHNSPFEDTHVDKQDWEDFFHLVKLLGDDRLIYRKNYLSIVCAVLNVLVNCPRQKNYDDLIETALQFLIVENSSTVEMVNIIHTLFISQHSLQAFKLSATEKISPIVFDKLLQHLGTVQNNRQNPISPITEQEMMFVFKEKHCKYSFDNSLFFKPLKRTANWNYQPASFFFDNEVEKILDSDKYGKKSMDVSFTFK